MFSFGKRFLYFNFILGFQIQIQECLCIHPQGQSFQELRFKITGDAIEGQTLFHQIVQNSLNLWLLKVMRLSYTLRPGVVFTESLPIRYKFNTYYYGHNFILSYQLLQASALKSCIGTWGFLLHQNLCNRLFSNLLNLVLFNYNFSYMPEGWCTNNSLAWGAKHSFFKCNNSIEPQHGNLVLVL